MPPPVYGSADKPASYSHPDGVGTAMSPAETRALYDLALGKVVLELGSWLGGSTLVLCQAAVRVHAVDWHRGDPHAGEHDTVEAYFANVRGCANLVSHVGRFEDVLPLFKPDSFDLVFLDGYHTEEATALAVSLADPLLRPGGDMVFHDYGLFGVKPVVDRMGGSVVVESLARA